MTSDRDIQAYYDEFSERYDDPRGEGYHAMIDELELAILEPFARGLDVVEVGCGTGLILEKVARVAKSARGVDLSPAMAQRAIARGLDVSIGSATEIPLPDETADVVCSFKVLAHVPELPRALSEMARITRPGGHLVFDLYNPWSIRYAAKRLAGPRSIGKTRNEADVPTRWDAPTVLHRVLPPGVELVDIRGVRIITPAAFVHRLPVVGPALRTVERALVASPLRYFGGFMVAIARKKI